MKPLGGLAHVLELWSFNGAVRVGRNDRLVGCNGLRCLGSLAFCSAVADRVGDIVVSARRG